MPIKNRLFSFTLALILLSLTACKTMPAVESNQTKTFELPWDNANTIGKIVDLTSDKQISAQQLITQLAAMPVVLVGETHDIFRHHQVELWLIQQLEQLRPQGSVALEMLNYSQQPAVNKIKQWLQTKPNVRGSRIAELINFSWDWQQYGDLVQYLLYQPYQLLATNLSRAELDVACQQPFNLTGTASIAHQVRNTISDIIIGSHAAELPMEAVTCMLNIQQLRDRRMASSLMQAAQPTLLFAGANHVDKSIGVPLHFTDLAPQAPQPTVVILAEDKYSIIAEQADYVWYLN